MKNAWGLICMIMLVVTASTALPSNDDAGKKTSKPEAKKVVAPGKAVQPAKAANSVQTNMAAPVPQWFGPALNKKNPSSKDKC